MPINKKTYPIGVEKLKIEKSTVDMCVWFLPIMKCFMDH